MRNRAMGIGLLIGIVGLAGCAGDIQIRTVGATLAANQKILDPYTLRGIDAAEAAGDVDSLNADLARGLVDANRRLAEEMKGGE